MSTHHRKEGPPETPDQAPNTPRHTHHHPQMKPHQAKPTRQTTKHQTNAPAMHPNPHSANTQGETGKRYACDNSPHERDKMDHEKVLYWFINKNTAGNHSFPLWQALTINNLFQGFVPFAKDMILDWQLTALTLKLL